MLLRRLCWLLPALIVPWMNLLQLGAALPTHDERSSAATSTMVHQDYKRVHPPDGKNDTQSSHKLVASPAGLLRPDKFQFYTYNDKGDMITRQMTAQEIQGLIAAGGADHVAMDRQEPQKAEDVLTGGKKVMDVVQKVQNVLKSALDKPPTLTGAIPKIPEHANVEWSNILPSILSGETDGISSNSESNQSPYKLTTERITTGSGSVGYTSSTGSALYVGTNVTMPDDTRKKPIIQSDVQTNAYGGFANNVEHSERPQYAHHTQQIPAAGAFTEKPMIPVPVITLTEQKLSTLQSAVTESPVFQMLSVIPVEAADSAHNKEDQTVGFATTEHSSQTVDLTNLTEQYVELVLSEVPEDSTFSQLTSLDIYPVNITKQTVASLDDKVSQGMGVSTDIYPMSTTSVSAATTTIVADQAATYNEFHETTDGISPSNTSYVLIQNKNNTSLSEDSSFAPGVTKESQVNGTYNDDKIILQTNTTISGPLSHASVPLKPQGLSNETASHLPSTFVSVSRIDTSTVPVPLHTDRLDENSTTVTEKLSINSATSTYTGNHFNPQSTKIQSPSSMEPLPTQLIDSFSSVMNQISEARPSVLSLMPEMSIVSINPGPSETTVADTRYDTFSSHSTNEENIERIVSSPGYATTKPPLQDATISTVGYSTTQRSTATATDSESTVNAWKNDVSAKPSTSTTIGATSAGVISDLATAPSKSNIASTDTAVSESVTSSSVWIQFENVHNTSPENQTGFFATPEIATVANAATSEKHVTDEVASYEKISPTGSIALDTVKTQPASRPTDTSYKTDTLNKPTVSSNEFVSTLIKLNWSNPVSAIEQVLNIAPLPSTTPTTEPISLPADTSNFLANDLASGLIAGFATSTSGSLEETTVNRIASHKNASSAHTVGPAVLLSVIKPAEAIENVTEIYKETVELNDDRQKERNVTDTSTQASLLIDSAKNGTLELDTRTNNNTCSVNVDDNDGSPGEIERVTNTKPNCVPDVTPSGENVLTKEPTKSSSGNEKIDDSTKTSSSSLLNSFANISDELKDSVGQDTIIAGVVTVNPESLSTMGVVDIQPTNNDKVVFYNTNYNQDKKEDGEKVMTTERPIASTDVSPELSRLPTKVVLIDSANDNVASNVNVSVHTESSPKTEILDEKDDLSANTSSATQTAHEQYQNLLGHTGFANDSNSALHSSHEYHRNNITASNVTLNPPISFLQNANRINNATLNKSEDSDTGVTVPITPHIATDNRTAVQNNENSHNTSSSVQEDSQIVKIVAQKLSADASGNNEESFRPSPVNGTHYPNAPDNASGQNNENVFPQLTVETTTTYNTTGSLAINPAMQTNGQPNNTESKPASSKHSENPSKPEIIHLQLSTLPPNVPVRQSVPKPAVDHKSSVNTDVPKTDADSNAEDKWTLISQQTPPVMTKLPKPSRPPKPARKPPAFGQQTSSNPDENVNTRSPAGETTAYQQNDPSQAQSVLPLDASQSASGLDVTVKHTSPDIVNFAKLCNELAFNFWVATNKGLSTARSLALSPFGMTSLLAMIFLGARGPTSDQMNEVLGLDDVATFNPHLVFQNITDTVSLARGQGIANAAFVRELFADKMKVRKLMPFYKEQAQQFYEGLVAEVNFATISDLVRRRTNLLIRKQTGGRIKDFVKTNTVPLRSPLAALSANVFQTDCNTSLTSSIGRDGELYFAVSPAVRQRRLVPVPATTWRSGVLAGYEPSIDATAVALGGSDRLISTIFVLPGQQGHTAPGDTLDRLEQRLVRSAFRDGTWNKLLKVLIPRNGLELQVPKFSHRSVVNATAALKRMGLDELFSGNADLKGINGIGHRLHLADVLQMNLFSTCGDENILSGRHHVETYPASPLRSIRRRIVETRSSDNVSEDDITPRYNGLPSQEDRARSLPHAARSHRERRQLSATSEKPRLKLDRPFLYFVRHNPSDIILHMGRFNPRLLP